MRFQQFSGKNSKELTTTTMPFTDILRAKVSTFPVAVVNFYFSFEGLSSLWPLCSFFHWLLSLLRRSIRHSCDEALVSRLAGRKWSTLILLKDTNVFSVQFNGYLLIWRLSSTCAYYKANTQTQNPKTILIHKNTKQTKQKQYGSQKQYKRNTMTQALNPEKHR